MGKRKILNNSLLIGGLLVLGGCGSPNVDQLLEDSIAALEIIESYSERTVDTFTITDGTEEEILEKDVKNSIILDPYMVEQTINMNENIPDISNLRYINGDLFLEDLDGLWMEIDEYKEELMIALLPDSYSEENKEASFNTDLLEYLKEYADSIEVIEHTNEYVIELTLDDESIEEKFYELIADRSDFGQAINETEIYTDIEIIYLSISVHIDKKTNYIQSQVIDLSGIGDYMDTNERGADIVFSHRIKYDYEDHDAVAAVVSPEDSVLLSDMLQPETAEESDDGYVDMEDGGQEMDLYDQPGVLATGEGDGEGAEDLFIISPPIYEDSPYSVTVESLNDHIAGFNTLTPDDAAMVIWSSVATQTDGQWEAWFVIVNRLGIDIKNVNTTFSFENQYGETIIADYPILLSEEEYGIITNGGIVPFKLTIPDEMESDFMDVITHIHAWPVVDTFEYEVVD